MLSLTQAILSVFVMGGVILACRILPFMLLAKSGSRTFARVLVFIERTVPPVAMTVLAFSSIAGEYKTGLAIGFYGTIASLCTVVLHLWKRNALVSILGGTGAYILLSYLGL
jgi:branched-subunit amino acid transport protein AzlD